MQPSDPSIPPVPAVAAPPAAPPPTPGDIDDVLDEQGGLLAALRGRLISLRTMSRPLRVATIVALVQLGLVGLLLATHDLPQPQVAAGIASNFSSARLPLITFVAVTLSLGLGWCFLLIGALRVHWRLRLAVVALVTVALGFYPVVQLRSDAGLTGQPFATERVLAWMQLGVLAVCWIWAISLALVGRSPSRRLKAAPEGPPATRSAAADPGRSDTVAARGSRPAASPGFPARTFWLVCALMAIYEGAALGVWLAYRQAGITLGVGVFAQSLTGQVFLLPLLLAAVIYWSSSDLIEWGELGGRALLRVVRRSDPVGRAGIPRLLIGLASVTALGVALDVLRVYGGSVVLPTLLAVALAGLLALLAVFARVDATWPTQVPATAVLAGVAFLFAEFVLEYQIGYALASWRGLPVDAAGPAVGVMVGMFVAVVAMTAGVLLVARGRLLRRGELGATGLFLVVATLLVLLGQWSLILGTLGLPAPHHPLHLLAGVRLVAALGTLGLVGWGWWAGRSRGRRRNGGICAGPWGRRCCS
jgi:hypothetical protein